MLPDSTEQVSDVLALANRHGVPVTPWSTGGNTGGGCIPQRGGIICDMRRMDRVFEIDEENMSVRIQPGATFGKVYVEAEKRGLRNVCPSAPASVSMLANYLDKGVFQLSNKYGVGTDSILGMVMVLPDGGIIRTGCLFQDDYGSICVEGPGPDISGMFHASMGIFGICTEMVAQLYPLPAVRGHTAGQVRRGRPRGRRRFPPGRWPGRTAPSRRYCSRTRTSPWASA